MSCSGSSEAGKERRQSLLPTHPAAAAAVLFNASRAGMHRPLGCSHCYLHDQDWIVMHAACTHMQIWDAHCI